MRPLAIAFLGFLLVAATQPPTAAADDEPTIFNDPGAFVPDPENAESTATITTPPRDGLRSGVLELRGTASAANGFVLVGVALRVDGHVLGWADGTSEWRYDLDTAVLVDGEHDLALVSYARPRAAAAYGPLMGAVTEVGSFETYNGNVAKVIHRFEMTGSLHAREVWMYTLDEDLAGVRFTITTPDDGVPPTLASVHVGYRELIAEDATTGDVTYGRWQVDSYVGDLHGGVFVFRPDGADFAAPGQFVMTADFAGGGSALLLVEALSSTTAAAT